ncbi:hypothetical protein [Nocardia sp. NBC_00403]|uniref:hypothetical protein n=1 Tax=Nocardia sp. NBC_00403 TaxID=2975990 RepID=UPI002E1C3E88
MHLDNQRSGRVYPRYLHPDVVTLAESGSWLSRFLTTPNGGPQIPELLALWGPDGLELAPNLRVVE